MDEGDAGPGRPVQMKGVKPGTAGFGLVIALAARVLAQDRDLTWHFPDLLESHVPGAYDGTRCAGLLRFLIQVPGSGAGRPAVICTGESLEEGYAGASGVDRRLLLDAVPRPGYQHRELCPDDRRRVCPAPRPRKRLLLLPPPPVTSRAECRTWPGSGVR
jgi:hypothetical protein